jgi:hypothetical protein
MATVEGEQRAHEEGAAGQAEVLTCRQARERFRSG